MGYDIYSVKVKKVGEVEFQTTPIDSFLGTNDIIVNELEIFMGNNEDFAEEYVILDEEFSFIENAGQEVDHMQELYKFIDSTSVKSYGDIEGVEVSAGKINVPLGNDVNQYNCIITNSNGYYNLLVTQDDAAAIATGMFTTTAASLAKASNIKKIKEEVEDEINDDLVIGEDDDVVSLDKIAELEEVEEEELSDDFGSLK